MARWSFKKALGFHQRTWDPTFVDKTEMAPGIPRPSWVLAGFIAAAILRDYKDVSKKKIQEERHWDSEVGIWIEEYPHEYCPSIFTEYTLNKDNTTCYRTWWSGAVNGQTLLVESFTKVVPSGYAHDTVVVKVRATYEDDTVYEFGNNVDYTLIVEAMDKSLKLIKELEEHEAKWAVQHKATAFIELLTQAREEDEEHFTYGECDCDSGCSSCKKPPKKRVKGCKFSCCNPKKPADYTGKVAWSKLSFEEKQEWL